MLRNPASKSAFGNNDNFVCSKVQFSGCKISNMYFIKFVTELQGQNWQICFVKIFATSLHLKVKSFLSISVSHFLPLKFVLFSP